jgi:hypothetical protein
VAVKFDYFKIAGLVSNLGVIIFLIFFLKGHLEMSLFNGGCLVPRHSYNSSICCKDRTNGVLEQDRLFGDIILMVWGFTLKSYYSKFLSVLSPQIFQIFSNQLPLPEIM